MIPHLQLPPEKVLRKRFYGKGSTERFYGKVLRKGFTERLTEIITGTADMKIDRSR
jgi:hypothetical protein